MMTRNILTGGAVQMETYKELLCSPLFGRWITTTINLPRSGKSDLLSHCNSW